MIILTEEQQLFQKTMRKFVDKEIAPTVEQYDEAEEFPFENFKKYGEMGILGLPVPAEYGAPGADMVTYVIMIEGLARVGGADAGIVVSHDVVVDYLAKFATEEQKKKYIPPLLDGNRVAAIAGTESNAGSDLAALETTAVKKDGQYLINGTKIFNSNGGAAETYLILAKTDKSKGAKGISSFLVEKGHAGFSFGQKFHKFSCRACVAAELIFEDCLIPENQLCGNEGEGFINIMKTFDDSRIAVAAISLGIGQGALENAANYSKQRVQFGRTISKNQAIQFMLSDMATLVEASRLLVYNGARLLDEKISCSKECSMAKQFSCDSAMKVTTDAVQIYGGYGLMKEYPVERLMRDAKQYQIVEGTNQIQRLIIARALLGKEFC